MGSDGFHQRVRSLAGLSVGRGCFFAALAIWCTMIGLIATPLQSLKAGAILTMLVCAILVFKSWAVDRQPYKQTEVYILLDRQIEVTPEVAQRLIKTSLRETYNRYALYAAIVALCFWAAAFVFWRIG